jgi:hypothetical protein
VRFRPRSSLGRSRPPTIQNRSSRLAKPPRDEETVELQIAALLSAWDRTSLCARREFLKRIDQRIMTAHRIRSANANPGGEATAS